jgi:hypothetical protein
MKAPATHTVNFADCYVLAHRRTKGFITSFLDRFLPRREQYTDTYEVPQFAEHPTIVFQSDSQLLDYLEHDLHTVHAIYWYHPQEETIRAAMCLFTSDGQVILGLTCETLYPDTRIEQECLAAIMDFCRSTVGLIEYEKPAPKDTEDMLRRIAAKEQDGEYPV